MEKDDSLNEPNEFLKGLAYDLRQRYAKIVGDVLDFTAQAMMQKDYNSYYTNLENLHTLTNYKWEDEISEIERTEYEKVKKEIIELANKYDGTWLGTSVTPNEIAEIEEKLRKMFMFLLTFMDKADMFGKKRDIESMM